MFNYEFLEQITNSKLELLLSPVNRLPPTQTENLPNRSSPNQLINHRIPRLNHQSLEKKEKRKKEIFSGLRQNETLRSLDISVPLEKEVVFFSKGFLIILILRCWKLNIFWFTPKKGCL